MNDSSLLMPAEHTNCRRSDHPCEVSQRLINRKPGYVKLRGHNLAIQRLADLQQLANLVDAAAQLRQAWTIGGRCRVGMNATVKLLGVASQINPRSCQTLEQASILLAQHRPAAERNDVIRPRARLRHGR